MDRFEAMTCDSEQVVNPVVDRQKSLKLCRRFEAPHLPFLLPGVLVGDFGTVILVLPRSTCNRWKGLPLCRRVASQLIRNELQRWRFLLRQDLAKETFGALLSRWRVTRISRISPS